MPLLLPYGLRKIWGHPANRAPGGLRAVARCLRRSGAWGSYQLQKQLGTFPSEGRVITWVDGLKVHLLRSSQLSQACLYYGLSDWPSMQFLRRFLRPGDLCADIGANVGIYSLLLARFAGASSVHAFECLPSNIPKLRANLHLNGFDGPGGVAVHAVALADLEGLMKLNVSDSDCTTSISPLPGGSGGETEEQGEEAWVKARRLDGFPWADRFAYIKIDVEGAEQLVMSGAEHLLRHAAPMVWSFEFLDTQQRLGSSKAALLETFTHWDYSNYLYRPACNRLVPFTPDANGAVPLRYDDNVLAIHASAINMVARRLCGLA
jgi:FkbM family methyltransferase